MRHVLRGLVIFQFVATAVVFGLSAHVMLTARLSLVEAFGVAVAPLVCCVVTAASLWASR